MRTETPYNPLDKKNLGVSVADAMLAQPIGPLPPSERFLGAGIYALYYSGTHAGKAVPAGARKGGFGLDIPAGAVLYNRLAEHAESIQGTKNLDINVAWSAVTCDCPEATEYLQSLILNLRGALARLPKGRARREFYPLLLTEPA